MLGQKLQQLRVKAGLSQTELADKVGVPVGSLRDWEVHAEEPGKGILSKLALVLNVREEDLVTELDESRQVREGTVVGASRPKP